MKVDCKELVKSLEKVYPAVGINILVPEFRGFQFRGDVVTATDGMIVMSTKLPLDLGVTILIPGTPFLQFLRGLKVSEIEVSLSKPNTFTVKAGKIKSDFTVLTDFVSTEIPLEGDFPEIENVSKFVDALNYCNQSVSRDETLGALCGVHVRENKMYGCDRFNILRVAGKFGGIRATFPAKLVEIFAKNVDKFSDMIYCSGTYFTVVLNDETFISSPVLQGPYPEDPRNPGKELDIEEYFPTDSATQEVFFTQDILDILDRHIVFLKEVDAVDRLTKISIKENKCYFTSKNANLGDLEEEVEYKASSETILITFLCDPVALKKIMENSPTFGFEVHEEKGIIYFNTNNYSYIMNISSEEE